MESLLFAEKWSFSIVATPAATVVVVCVVIVGVFVFGFFVVSVFLSSPSSPSSPSSSSRFHRSLHHCSHFSSTHVRVFDSSTVIRGEASAVAASLDGRRNEVECRGPLVQGNSRPRKRHTEDDITQNKTHDISTARTRLHPRPVRKRSILLGDGVGKVGTGGWAAPKAGRREKETMDNDYIGSPRKVELAETIGEAMMDSEKLMENQPVSLHRVDGMLQLGGRLRKRHNCSPRRVFVGVNVCWSCGNYGHYHGDLRCPKHPQGNRTSKCPRKPRSHRQYRHMLIMSHHDHV